MVEKTIVRDEKRHAPRLQMEAAPAVQKEDYFFVEKPKTPKSKKKESDILREKAEKYENMRYKTDIEGNRTVIKNKNRYLELTIKAFECYMKAGELERKLEAGAGTFDFIDAANDYLEILAFREKGFALKTRDPEAKSVYENAGTPLETAKMCVRIAIGMNGYGSSEGNDTAAFYRKAGDCFEKAGMPDDAAEAYVLGNDAKNAVRIYMGLGKPEKAAEAYVRLHDLVNAGKIYEGLGMLEKAAELYAKVPEKYVNAAEIYERLGNTARAAELYESAGNAQKAAQLYEKSGMLENAAGQYLHAAEIDGIEPLANYLKAGEIFEKLMKKSNAGLCYEKAAGLCEGKLKKEYLGKSKRLLLETRLEKEGAFINPEEFTPKMRIMLEAVKGGGEEFRKFAVSQGMEFSPGTHWGPNVDGAFYNRESDTSPYFPVPSEKRKFLGLPNNAPSAIINVKDAYNSIYFGMVNHIPIPQFDAKHLMGENKVAGISQNLLAELHMNIEMNSDKIASFYEMNLLYQLNLAGRYAGAGKCVYFSLKHFPGGDAFVEATHGNIYAYPDGLKELVEGFAKPFADAIRNPSFRVTDIMIGHQAFPNAEKELRKKYSFPSIWPDDVSLPSSISPYMVRGLLRKEFGFEGRAYADAEAMNGFSGFISTNKGKLPGKLPYYSDGAIAVISEIYAGVEPYFTLFNNELTDGKLVRNEVKEFYSSNPEFKAVFDEFALVDLISKLKKIPAEERPGLPYDVQNILLSDINSPKNDQVVVGKLRKWLDEGGVERKMKVILGEIYNQYEGGHEVWNVGGLMDLMLRKAIVEKMNPRLEFKNMKEFKTEREWTSYLFSTPEFVNAYNAIDWNGIEMRSVFREYYRQLTDYGAEKK